LEGIRSRDASVERTYRIHGSEREAIDSG
jgi:hypothetical protein